MLEIENIVAFLMGKAASSVKGLEFESGTITLEENSATLELIYTNSHDTRPYNVMILDTGDTLTDENAVTWISMSDWYDAFGKSFPTAENAVMLARYQTGYKTASSVSTSGSNITTDSDPLQNTDMGYYSTTEKFTAYPNRSAGFFKAGRPYQWVAVWAPALPAEG